MNRKNPNRVVKIQTKLPTRNAAGQRYPRWHPKHPKNAVAIPASVLPSK